jgi:hypothetical protein
LTLKALLRNRPVIYEIVPPRRDTSRFSTELRGVEEVLQDRRIAAINIPELIRRREERGGVVYSPATIPPEEYAMMIREYKEPIVDIIAPRLAEDALLRRARKILVDYKIPNLVLVGRERRGDRLPGPEVIPALALVSKISNASLGGICIFSRKAAGTDSKGAKVRSMAEAQRVWHKAEAGCDFVTSQISFDPKPVTSFLREYQALCERTGRRPLTVFVSVTTVPTPSILKLLESLDVVVPPRVRKAILNGASMGKESVGIATEIIREVVVETEKGNNDVPLGLQIEQVGVNSGTLSLDLLDAAGPIFGGG